MNVHRENLYGLAQMLHKCVYEVEVMPASEYFGWLDYMRKRTEEQERAARAASGDLLALSPQDMIAGLTK